MSKTGMHSSKNILQNFSKKGNQLPKYYPYNTLPFHVATPTATMQGVLFQTNTNALNALGRIPTKALS